MKILHFIKAACLAALTGLLCGTNMGAQGLPTLDKAPEITTGSLPDGISYYLVKNPGTPGFADFALVQPKRSERSNPREELVSLPHFWGRKPYDFLASHSVGYSRRGHIHNLRDATVFRFADVPVGQREVSDSTLLMLFDIARSSEYEQAVVVSGDIDVNAVTERIRILSMTISRRKDASDDWGYKWRPQDKASITVATSPVGAISVRYRSPRTERELMNTIQPVMSRLLASELDIILEHRLRAAFIAAGVPLADYRYRYTGSDETAGDELFSLLVFTAPESLEQALKVIAGVLASLDEEGATLDEVQFARTVIAESTARESAGKKMSNSEYLDKCIASYLYGANLASPATLSTVFTGRKLDLDRERELLNRYISGTFSASRNLHLRVSGPQKPDAERVGKIFAEGWKEPDTAVSELPSSEDTLRFIVPRRKVKLKNASYDSFTGGKMWTFSNGVSVVFKKTEDKGAFQYGMMLKGGWTEIPGIRGSEAAFAGDVLALNKFADMSASRLKDMLAMYGVSFEPQISISDVRFVGTAPSRSLSLVLKTMLAVASGTEADHAAFARYLREKPVRLKRDMFSEEGTQAVLDSIMCPGYPYAAGSLPQLPREDFNLRMTQYLLQKTANMKNCVIVLVGDLDEAVTRKHLTHILSGFRTGQGRVVRPRMQYPLRECWTTNSVQGNWRSRGVSVSLCGLWPFGSEGYNQMELARTLLKSELDRALASDGMYCSVSGRADLLPVEKITLYIHCEPVVASGLPADVSVALSVQALMTVRSVINNLATNAVSEAKLNHLKDMLINRRKSQEGSTPLLRDAVLDRYSLGRDVKAGYAQRIKNVQPEDLRKMFERLSHTDCEYVVQ